MKPGKWTTRIVWVVVVFLALSGVAMVAGRSVSMIQASRTGVEPSDPYALFFVQQRLITFAHILPGLLFMVLGPLQFVKRIRARHIGFHRWSGRVLLISVALIGFSALKMGTRAFGGPNETAATYFFASIFLFAFAKALFHIRRREIAAHREWMIRGFSIGLGIVTIRPVVGMFIAFSNMNQEEILGIAFWIGFSLHLLAAEIWIHITRPSRATAWAATVSPNPWFGKRPLRFLRCRQPPERQIRSAGS